MKSFLSLLYFFKHEVKICLHFLKSDSSNHSYVGFANLPNQVHRKFVKKGFEFTLMVVGLFSESDV